MLIYFGLCLPLAPDQADVPFIARSLAPATSKQDSLPVSDPIAFLEKCLERYEQQGIKGYSALMRKQERIDGKLHLPEEIEIFFREKPHGVFMHWLRGQRRAESVVYVEGENKGQMLVRPAGVAGVFVKVAERDPEGEAARQAGRYTVKDFGMKKAMLRVLDAWKAQRDAGTLQVAYLGVRKVREAGDRPCYTLRQTLAKPDADGITETTLYIDKENWLQVGTVLKGEDNKLLGEYMFRDIRINPEFKANQFQRSALTP
jgi:hypothetical protein